MKKEIWLSYTAISEFITCPQYYQFSREFKLEPDKPALGMMFGSAAHVGINVLYDTEDIDKAVQEALKSWSPFEGTDIEKSGRPGIRTKAKLEEILRAYHSEFYGKEKWEDQGGEKLSFIVLENDLLRVKYFYKVARKGLSGGVPATMEFKFQKPFFTREFIPEPNNQVVGYLKATERKKAIITVADIVTSSENGIIPGKRKMDMPRSIFKRDPVFYEPWVMERWEKSIFGWSRLILECKESNNWPMAAPNSCGNYGGCQFKTLCNADVEQRKILMELGFRKKAPHIEEVSET